MELVESSKKKRLINFLIDVAVIVSLLELIFTILAYYDDPKPLTGFVPLLITFIYYTFMEYLLAKTVGKFVTNTEVVNRDGSKIDFRTAVIRTLCRAIPFEYISLLLGADAIAWHDAISKTYVIDNPDDDQKT